MKSVKATVIIHPNIPDRTTVDDRMRFLHFLERNLRDSFGETGIEYSRIQIVKQQIIVETHAVENIMKMASNVFGVVAVSVGEEIDADTNIHSASIIRGIGGLPTGYEGRVVCMISSGLDSPVASFKAMRRGCVPIFVYFDNSPFSDDSNKKIAIEQAKRLSQYIHGSEVKMYIVPHGEDLVEVLKHAPRRMTCIFCRRNMYRLAQEVAIREEANAIITGEIIGEQASQTTSNLFAENSAVDKIPIIRPCIGDDKDEIVKKAREIGTYHFAEEAASCCSLPPKFPTINARTSEIPVVEEKIREGWVKYAVDDAEIIILKEEFKTG
ncbi:MAG: hypothetical protein ACFFED_06190 [Candidatus Thorarchaeota archaeon]